MPLIQSTPDHLPYIDSAPSEDALSAADTLIRAEIEPSTTLHPMIPALPTSTTSNILQQEFDRVAAGRPISGVDLARYEALDPPAKGDLDGWRTTMQQAYTSYEYLRGRELNLGLLETYGKNAWLISNSQLEDVLRELEREVDTTNGETENVEQERRNLQGSAAGEMQSLQDTWRQGIGRMIEAQVAGERVRQEILTKHRQGVS